MQGPFVYLHGLSQARAGGRFDFFPARYLRYLGAVASLSSFCYPPGSRKWLSRRIRLVAVAATRAGAARLWLGTAGTSALLRRVAVARPLLLEKPFRPLGALGLCFYERARLMLEHYAVMDAMLPVCICDRIYMSGGMTWTPDDGAYALRLADPGPNPKEGELAFYWMDREAGICLAQLSFYLRQGPSGPEVFIGGLQGPMGETSRERIRIATRASEGLRPKDVVMEALLAFAAHVGARRVTAVSRDNHVGRQRHTPREIQCDYEGFWMEYHGTAQPDGNIEIPVRQPERDIAAIASKKRSAWRRKQALAQTVRAAVGQWLQADGDDAAQRAAAPVAPAAPPLALASSVK